MIAYKPVNRANWIAIGFATSKGCERMSAVMCRLFDIAVRKSAVYAYCLIGALALVIGVNHVSG